MKAAREPARHQIGEQGLTAFQAGAVRIADLSFGRVEISGAQLDGAGAEREGRGDSASVGDPARGDHRHPDRISDLREKREQAYGFRRVGAEEAAGVTARLESLRDHGIDAALGQPLRLGDRGGAAEDDRAGGFDAVKQRSVGQAEMEADDLGAKLLDDGAHRLVEGQAKRTAAIRLDAEFIIIRLEQCPPRRVVRRFGHSVTEEVEVDRPARPRPDLGDLVAHLIRREQSAWQRAKPAALNCRNRQPHAGSAGHGRATIGCSTFTRSRKRWSGQLADIDPT